MSTSFDCIPSYDKLYNIFGGDSIHRILPADRVLDDLERSTETERRFMTLAELRRMLAARGGEIRRLFNTSGTRVSGNFSWSARGV